MWREQRLDEDPRRGDSAGPEQLSPNNTTGSGLSVGVTDLNAIGICQTHVRGNLSKARTDVQPAALRLNQKVRQPSASYG
jgi:hypothetical protein